jgi:hypothetical protein
MNSGNIDPWSGDDVPVAPGLGEIVGDTPSAHTAARDHLHDELSKRESTTR